VSLPPYIVVRAAAVAAVPLWEDLIVELRHNPDANDLPVAVLNMNEETAIDLARALATALGGSLFLPREVAEKQGIE